MLVSKTDLLVNAVVQTQCAVTTLDPFRPRFDHLPSVSEMAPLAN